MKTKRLSLLALPALLLIGCQKNNSNSSLRGSGGGSTPSEGGGLNTPLTPADYFDNYENQTPHNRLKEIADNNDGFTLQFDAFSQENNDVLIENHLTLGRKGNVAWATNTLSELNPNPYEIPLPYTIKGAVEYKNEQESSIDVYYANNEEDYTYYGTAYDSDLGFSIEDIETYFSLSDALFVALVMQQQATLVTKANRRCFSFVMTNTDFGGNYVANSQLEIAFDSETRLIMYYNYWRITFDEQNKPTVNMTVLRVNAFNFAVDAPTLSK